MCLCARTIGIFQTLLTSGKARCLSKARRTLDHMQELDAVPGSNDRASLEEEYMLESRV
ncbi:hypothetical protein [Nitrosomonas marina]|uniref:hypothetical protein n=1 Tax=Nitrosomonas marina TaxID=917 RepID=UPI003182D51D